MGEDLYDFVVLGGGSAGYAGARTAAALGLRVAVIDGAEELGGLCILKGCMPSKTWIESANRFRAMREAKEFGLRAGSLEVRMSEIRERKRRLIAEFAGYRRGQLEAGTFDLIRGTARFLDGASVEVRLREEGEVWRTVRGRAFLVATGSEISVLELPGLEEAGFWTSDAVLEAGRLPESVLVLGGGAIALECAQLFEGLGSRVTVIQRSGQILKAADADVAGALAAGLERRGVRLHCGTRLLRAERAGERVAVWFEQGGRELRAEAEEILVATGRRPRTRGLDLERAGVRCGEGGRVMTGPDQRSSCPSVFAAGDVSSPLEVVHLAIAQGEVAARNAARQLGRLGGAAEETDYRLKLFGVFTQPELAMAGWTEKELAERGVAFRSARYPFDDHGKSLISGETDGFVKLIAAEGSGEILGSAVVGPHAVELIHETVVAMRYGATVGEFAGIPHYHPTLSEIWTYPAEELAERLSRTA